MGFSPIVNQGGIAGQLVQHLVSTPLRTLLQLQLRREAEELPEAQLGDLHLLTRCRLELLVWQRMVAPLQRLEDLGRALALGKDDEDEPKLVKVEPAVQRDRRRE